MVYFLEFELKKLPFIQYILFNVVQLLMLLCKRSNMQVFVLFSMRELEGQKHRLESIKKDQRDKIKTLEQEKDSLLTRYGFNLSNSNNISVT